MQPRDLAIVDAVHRHRVLTSAHIAALLFGHLSGAGSYCRKRLQHLSEAGYLDRREQLQTRAEGRKPYLYFLAPAGVQLLVEELGVTPETISWKKSFNNVAWQFLRHQLAINDAYIALFLAAPTVGWRLATWTDDRLLRASHTDRFTIAGVDGRMVETTVVPDAHCVMEVLDDQSGSSGHLQFFIECDLASEVVAASVLQRNSWQRKIRAYQSYFDSDAIISRYRTRHIRVLTITTSRQRLANLKAATEAEGGRSRYWFAAKPEVSPATVLQAPIWYKAGEEHPVRLTR